MLYFNFNFSKTARTLTGLALGFLWVGCTVGCTDSNISDPLLTGMPDVHEIDLSGENPVELQFHASGDWWMEFNNPNDTSICYISPMQGKKGYNMIQITGRGEMPENRYQIRLTYHDSYAAKQVSIVIKQETDSIGQHEEELFDLFTRDKQSLENICKQHKLTKVIVGDYSIQKVVSTLPPQLIDSYHSYKDKGLGMVFLTTRTQSQLDDIFGDNYYSYKKTSRFIQYNYLQQTDVTWLLGTSRLKPGYCYLLDRNGQALYSYPIRQGMSNLPADDYEAELLDSVLGAPVTPAKPFQFRHYTSTDYSRDGESFLIQRATEGCGIELILIGEGFVDKDLEPDGACEQRLRQAAECLFKTEPMRSLRNRFTIFGIKTVSPNGVFAENAVHCIDGNGEIAGRYAERLTDRQEKYSFLGIIYNADHNIGRSRCISINNDSFIAYCKGLNEGTIIHEMVGHGLGRLADEYTENSYIGLTISAEDAGRIRTYQKSGRYTNVSTTADPDKVPWIRFLKDSRYAMEKLGIFEGARTGSFGVYRATSNSIMKDSQLGCFNAPGREAVYKNVMTLSEGDSWGYDYETFVRFDEPGRRQAIKACASSTGGF